MDRSTSLLKALDLLGIISGHETGLNISDLSEIMNLPRSTVVRVLNTIVEYGLVKKIGKRYVCGAPFEQWSKRNRYAEQVKRYRPLLEQISQHTEELTLLGMQEGNGVVHIDYIETDHRVRVAPAPATRHPLRHTAMGKLLIARRPDLREQWIKKDPDFRKELLEIDSTGVAWNLETIPGLIAMATHGYSKAPTEPVLAVAWPAQRYSEAEGRNALDYIQSNLSSGFST